MIPTNKQFTTAKHLCKLIMREGHNVNFRTLGNFGYQEARISVCIDGKPYNISDPDWNIVNKQLRMIVDLVVA